MRPSILPIVSLLICVAATTKPATPEAEIKAAVTAVQKAKETNDIGLLKSVLDANDLNLQYWEGELGERKAREEFREAVRSKFGKEGAKFASQIDNLVYTNTLVSSVDRIAIGKVMVNGDTAVLTEPSTVMSDPPILHRLRKVKDAWKEIDDEKVDAARFKDLEQPVQVGHIRRINQLTADVRSGKLRTFDAARAAWEQFDGVQVPIDQITVQEPAKAQPPKKKEPEVAGVLDRLTYESTMTTALQSMKSAMKLDAAQAQKVETAQEKLAAKQKDFRAGNAAAIARMLATQREIDETMKVVGGNADPDQLYRKHEPHIVLYRKMRDMQADCRTEIESVLTPEQRVQWQAAPIRDRLMANLEGVELTAAQKGKIDPALAAAAKRVLAKSDRSITDVFQAADDVTTQVFGNP